MYKRNNIKATGAGVEWARGQRMEGCAWRTLEATGRVAGVTRNDGKPPESMGAGAQ